MKGLLLLLLAGALLAPPGAHARDWHAGIGGLTRTQGQPPQKGPGQFLRGDPVRRGEHDKRNQGRLTQEERRELHRDLDRANREIYRRR